MPAAQVRPEDVFGGLVGTFQEQLQELDDTYRRLLDEGEVAAPELEDLHREARQALLDGRYGRGPLFAAPEVVRGDKGSYTVLTRLDAPKGNGYPFHLTLASGDDGPVLLKTAKDEPADDLLRNEALALEKLNDPKAVESRLRPYVPVLIESFSRGVKKRQANALKHLDGFYSLRQVRAAYPKGLHWADLAWMFRRLLVAAGYAHANGVVHGAILPENVFIEPKEHGLVLAEWAYAVPAGTEELRHRPDEDAWYPPEALDNSIPPGPYTDVYLLGRTMQYALGADAPDWRVAPETPARLRAFLDGLTARSARARPEDAWEILQELDELLGTRKFRPFSMPQAKGEGATDSVREDATPAGLKTAAGLTTDPADADPAPAEKGDHHG